MLHFIEPYPAEEEPQAIDYLFSQVLRKIPVAVEAMPPDVSLMQFTRKIDSGTAVLFSVHLDTEDDDFIGLAPMYAIEIQQTVYADDEPTRPSKVRTIGVGITTGNDNEPLPVLSLTIDNVEDWNEAGDQEESADEEEGDVEGINEWQPEAGIELVLNTRQLIMVIETMDKLPDRRSLMSSEQ